MELQGQISRRLHEEHVAILDLLGRFGQSLARLRGEPPAAGDPVWDTLLAQLATALEYEITRHFSLEEEQLFPRLHQHGEGELAELLLEEHEVIRAVTRPLLGLIQRARSGGLDAAGWRSLKFRGSSWSSGSARMPEKRKARWCRSWTRCSTRRPTASCLPRTR